MQRHQGARARLLGRGSEKYHRLKTRHYRFVAIVSSDTLIALQDKMCRQLSDRPDRGMVTIFLKVENGGIKVEVGRKNLYAITALVPKRYLIAVSPREQSHSQFSCMHQSGRSCFGPFVGVGVFADD